MGVLANAVSLAADPVWRQWLIAASTINARTVILEDAGTADHNVRLALANSVAMDPPFAINWMLIAVTTDPAVLAAGGTPAAVTEQVCLDKVLAYWTFVAKKMFPTVT